MTELERCALMGDKQAQKECTEKGILLPCPFCGGKKTKVRYACGDYFVDCLSCHSASGVLNTKELVVKLWNTRQAPPIGRCEECEFYNTFDCICSKNGYTDTIMESCSFFEPKESEKMVESYSTTQYTITCDECGKTEICTDGNAEGVRNKREAIKWAEMHRTKGRILCARCFKKEREEKRLIDANKVGKEIAVPWQKAIILSEICEQPTIDPEDLPLVQELRAKLEQVKAERDALAGKLTSIESKKKDGKLVELPCLPTDDFWWANEDDGKVYKRNSEEVIGIVVLAGGELKVLDVDGNLDPINSQYACQSEKIAEEFLKGAAQKGDSQ